MSSQVPVVPQDPQASSSIYSSLARMVLRLLGLAVVDTLALWLVTRMFSDGNWQVATAITVITLLINVVFIREDLYPIRWMAPGLALMLLMVIYPIIFTVYIAFTNFSDGHLLTKQQAITLITREQFLPDDAETFRYTAYRDAAGQYALVLLSESGEPQVARVGEPIVPLAEIAEVGPLDESGVPESFAGFSRLNAGTTLRSISELGALEFGVQPGAVKVSSVREAAAFEARYSYDEAQDAIIDQQSGALFPADSSQGNFVSADGALVRPGYRVEIGTRNFERILGNPALRGPFLRVFLWTFVFAFMSVITTFALGLGLAMVFNDPHMPGKKLIRSILLIPYTIPAVISILIWRGLLNPRFGLVNQWLNDIFGTAPNWFSDPTMAKVALILINLWLGYPYMMLIATAGLQAVPSDVYEAAEVDGASPWQRFWGITLPLLMISMAPLLISSFAFNLNNFNIIFLYNEGGPPISGAPTPAGHTDILISYTYRLAFAGGRGADFGFASAITLIIFVVVAAITFVNFRYTKALEEVSENV